MTRLLAVEKDGTIYCAGDRCESSGYLRHELAHAKWIAFTATGASGLLAHPGSAR